jgi:hypothetical protein
VPPFGHFDSRSFADKVRRTNPNRFDHPPQPLCLTQRPTVDEFPHCFDYIIHFSTSCLVLRDFSAS